MKHILVPFDFSTCSSAALAVGLEWAHGYGAHLHVIHVEVIRGAVSPKPDVLEKHAATLKEQIEAVINEHSERVGVAFRKSVSYSFSVIEDVAACPPLLAYIHEHQIDQVIMGTHGHRGLRRAVLGSVAEETVRFAPCPVLTVHADDLRHSFKEDIKRILVPLDFSASSSHALQRGRELAGVFGAELTLLHVIEDILHPFYITPEASSIYNFQPDLEARARSGLEKLYAATRGPEVPVNYRLIPGNPIQEIVLFAEKKYTDLIVIASHGLTGLDRALLGSVTERVVRMATCPVYTLKPKRSTKPEASQRLDMDLRGSGEAFSIAS